MTTLGSSFNPDLSVSSYCNQAEHARGLRATGGGEDRHFSSPKQIKPLVLESGHGGGERCTCGQRIIANRQLRWLTPLFQPRRSSVLISRSAMRRTSTQIQGKIPRVTICWTALAKFGIVTASGITSMITVALVAIRQEHPLDQDCGGKRA